jgi:hypothetical protein
MKSSLLLKQAFVLGAHKAFAEAGLSKIAGGKWQERLTKLLMDTAARSSSPMRDSALYNNILYRGVGVGKLPEYQSVGSLLRSRQRILPGTLLGEFALRYPNRPPLRELVKFRLRQPPGGIRVDGPMAEKYTHLAQMKRQLREYMRTGSGKDPLLVKKDWRKESL